jgi:bla regulator protein blaR1
MLNELTNHLWQSTIFAIVAGIMTVAFRKNRAQVRYGLWLTASLKFLVPFSLLMSLGSHLEWEPATHKIAASPVVAFTMARMSQPFSGTLPLVPPIQRSSQEEAAIWIFAVWMCGLLSVLLMRLRGLQRIRAVVRSSTPVDMRNLSRASHNGTNRRRYAQTPAIRAIEIRRSIGLLEPGVVGLFHPILLLPEGIVERLTPRQFAAVLAHELCHVRRRDNLTSAIHMVVEAVFWFHPLVWWIGARLMEERERACDEAVLSLGNQRDDYAAGILSVCKNYLESPLACVPGITGSNLKKRIHAILTADAPGGLNFRKKSTLAVAGVAAIAVPIAAGIVSAAYLRAQSQPNAAQSADAVMPKFEVASIKRNPSAWSDPSQPMGVRMERGGRLHAQNAPLTLLIQRAYGVQAFQVTGGPAWGNTDGYEIEAKPEGPANQKQMWLMLRTLLADRFKLRLHWETRELPVYDLMVAKGGPKLPVSKAVGCVSRLPGAPPAPPGPGLADCGYVAGPFGPTKLLEFEGTKVHMADFISKLELVMGRPVVDKTEFTRDFDLKLDFTADEATMGLAGFAKPGYPHADGFMAATDPNLPNIFAALQEQLGLKLVSAKGPVEVLAIDHVERPTAN